MGKGGEKSENIKIKESKIVRNNNDSYYSKILTPPKDGGTHRNDFYHSAIDEPHAARRKEILKKYPEIESLFGPDIRPLPFVILIMMSQLYLGYLSKNWSSGFFFLVAWIYGGAASHALSLMTHELSHNLLFSTPMLNDYFGIFCNIAMGVPSSTMFKRYHMEHHLFQGDREKDCDIPTFLEGKIFTSTLFKLCWLILQPAFYSMRPGLVRPKPFRLLDWLNLCVILISNALMTYFTGSISMIVFLISSTLLGMGIHPVAGHFISEHYIFDENYETYSYYGSLNYICWNVGYHNEHHDFPRVPGWKLPLVKRIASEYYDNLPSHKSWTYVLWQFVTDDRISPFSRVIRTKKVSSTVMLDPTGVNTNDVDPQQKEIMKKVS